MSDNRAPALLQSIAAIDGEHLAMALVAASEHPDWVDQILTEAPFEVLRDAMQHLAVDWLGRVLHVPDESR